ncbi:MAG: hypothetical protein CFE21_05355 [Bacteroidetes bacterium B1(2017)]|nr:MAG: hypothetical protein CFE21_05355 [Bacteroidetes bacterium B1(2017)]
MKKIFLLIALWGVGVNLSLAQFQTGLVASNHAGVMGVTINPANTNYLNNGTDFTLFNYSTTLMNNGYYLQPKPITQLASPKIIKAFTGGSAGDGGESINQTFDRIFDLKRSFQKNNYIFADATIYGPSLLINYKKHSFGLLTSLKSISGSINMPKELEIFLIKGSSAVELQGKSFDLNKFVSGTMVYSDIAFNYSYEIAETYNTKHRLGITAHYLTGINSLDFEDKGGSKWTFVGDSTIVMENGNLLYNYSATKASTLGEMMASRGSGFAFDIGYNFLKKKKSRPTRITVCPNIRFGGKIREYQDYLYRFGISLMDVGMINFNRQTVYSEYQNASGSTKNLDQAFYKGIFALDRQLRYDFSGNPGTTFILDNKYTHYTATRLNVQFDYHFKNNIYFSFAGSHRLPMPGAISMRSPNILSVSARYETLKYELGFPISLIEYQYPIIGLNFRIGPFYMGTNHLPEIIGLRNIRGVDVFMGLKINLSNFRGV